MRRVAIALCIATLSLTLACAPAEPAVTPLSQLQRLTKALVRVQVATGKYPLAATVDAEGRPLLSWRIQLLPHLGEEELFKQFHLDEPWDSPHNKPLVGQMPTAFQTPGSNVEPGMTCYVFPRGQAGAAGSPLAADPQKPLVIEADDAHAVPWTKPADLELNPQAPWQGVRLRDGVALVGTWDGFVVRFRPSADRASAEMVKD